MTNEFGRFLAVLCVAMFVVPVSVQSTVAASGRRGVWLYVGGSGPGNYSRIQDAINASSDGDTVFVYPGVYPEHVTINTSLRLLGDATKAVIDGQLLGQSTVLIHADEVTVEGFTLLLDRTWTAAAAVYVLANHSLIQRNIISSASQGEAGIRVDYGEKTQIRENIIQKQDEGIVLFYTPQNTIENNTVTECGEAAIVVAGSALNTLQHNTVDSAPLGISLRNTCSNLITANRILNCTKYGLDADSDFGTTKGNTITANVFNGNSQDAYFILPKGRSANTWKGNYWHEPLQHPTLIHGAKVLYSLPPVPFYFPGFQICIPWVAVDWHPAR